MEVKTLLSIYKDDFSICCLVVDSVEFAKTIAELMVSYEIEWEDFVPGITCKPETNPLEYDINIPRLMGSVWYGKTPESYDWFSPDIVIAISELKSISTEDVEYIKGLQS